MNEVEFYEILSKELKRYNNEIDETKSNLLYQYMKKILDWNQNVNLTAIKNEKDFIIKHFVDSLTVTSYIDDSRKIIDVGTGGGFPGIPLKIFFPNSKIDLVDSTQKKLNIIKEISSELNFNELNFIHARAEELGQNNNYREKYDVAISRAVANLPTLVEYLLPLCRVGGKVICMKGPNIQNELLEAKYAINVLGGKLESKINLSVGNEERNIIIINKIKNTPKNYPRKNGIPLKNPIKKYLA